MQDYRSVTWGGGESVSYLPRSERARRRKEWKMKFGEAGAMWREKPARSCDLYSRAQPRHGVGR